MGDKMKCLILIMVLLSGCAKKTGLDLLPEGATREIWESTDRLAKAKNRAGHLLDQAREKYAGTDRMQAVRDINKQTVACTNALPLSEPKRMAAFQAEMHSPDRATPDSYYLRKMADFYNDASLCYDRHNIALMGLLK